MKKSLFSLFFCLGLFFFSASIEARDASFLDPSGGNGMSLSTGGDAITVEPKGDIDAGDTMVSVPRRVTVFFANKSTGAVDIQSVVANGDGNVQSEIVNDDCKKQGKLAPAERCAVEVEVTPSTYGSWTSEVLMTHNGSGRIARAKIKGKTSGQGSTEKHDTGLTLNTKDAKPVDFGEVPAGGGKAVRSALMVNDSNETITLLSIEVIAAENGLERLDQGCTVDMELKPGESCPVTMVWKPEKKGQVSTDLIIRHTGRLGFAVVPIRGTSKSELENAGGDAKGEKDNKEKDSPSDKSGKAKQSDQPEDLAAIAAQLPPLPSGALPSGAMTTVSAAVGGGVTGGSFHLIGTIGNRAILFQPDGTTAIVGIGEDISYGSGKNAKLTQVQARSAEIFIDGKKKTLLLESVSALTDKAAKTTKSDAPSFGDNSSSSEKDTGSANGRAKARK